MSLSVYNVISMAVIFFLFRLSFLAGSSQGFFRRSDPLFLAFLLLFFGSSLESRSFHSRSERELLLSQHRISVTRASQEMVFGFSPGISMEAFLSLFIRSGVALACRLNTFLVRLLLFMFLMRKPELITIWKVSGKRKHLQRIQFSCSRRDMRGCSITFLYLGTKTHHLESRDEKVQS
ncbi:uncharacterized protein LOC120005552 isoform X2 [Tripterygium wilfordii]|uniref:uncharacterized protein LOC120005552 isoform X2 n=1 Tax=Tripterygium wilfordii TaxID=458696 RepID=UPI0018F83C2C|nr:uncharacterized protein LOC120005552 isoform X2 [Tripterygium wilfordii]